MSEIRKSICICFSGEMRNFESNNEWISQISKYYDVEIVISTWQERGAKVSGAIDGPRMMKMLPDSILHAIPPHLMNAELFVKFPHVLASATHRAMEQVIEPKLLQSVFPGSHAHIEPRFRFAWFEDARKEAVRLGEIPQGISDPFSLQSFYKIWQADMMRQNLEHSRGKKFDIVMRVRPDRQPKDVPHGLLNGLEEDVMYTNIVRHDKRWVNDMFFVATSDTMSKISNFFHHAFFLASQNKWKFIHYDLYDFFEKNNIEMRAWSLNLTDFATDAVINVEDFLGDSTHYETKAGRDSAPNDISVSVELFRKSLHIARNFFDEYKFNQSEEIRISHLNNILSIFESNSYNLIFHFLETCNAELKLENKVACIVACLAKLDVNFQNMPVNYYARIMYIWEDLIFTTKNPMDNAESWLDFIRNSSQSANSADAILNIISTQFLDKSEPDVLLARVRDALSLVGRDVGMWVRAAWRLHRASQCAASMEMIERGLKLDPNNPHALVHKAILLKESGSLEYATKIIKFSASISPNLAFVRRCAAEILLLAGLAHEAVVEATALVKLQPELPQNHVLLAQALALDGKHAG